MGLDWGSQDPQAPLGYASAHVYAIVAYRPTVLHTMKKSEIDAFCCN